MEKLTISITAADLMDWDEDNFPTIESAEDFLDNNRNIISEQVTSYLYSVLMNLL